MTRLDWWLDWLAAMGFPIALALTLAVLFLCAGCTRTTETRAEQHIAVQETQATKASEKTTEVVQTGPETITTTTEEFEEPPSPVPAGPLAAAEQNGSQHPDGRPAPGRPFLVKRTVIVDHRDPITDTKTETARQASTEATTATLEAKTSKDTKTAPSLAGWLWLLLIGAGVLAVAGLAWKFSLPGRLMALFRV